MTQHDYADIALFIAGTWIGPEERETQPVINPATAQQIGLIAKATPDDLEASVRSARVAFEGWRQLSPLDRSAILRRFANLLRENEQAIAAAITLDEGKPLAEAIVEVRSSADHIDWHAEEGRRIYGRIIPSRSPAVQQQVLREPVGVCLAITPWNFPLSQAVRKVAAALACGCTMILKGPAEAPSACMAIARYLQEAGLPDGCLNLVWGNAAMISETLVAHPDVRKITFTGSVEVGNASGSIYMTSVGGDVDVKTASGDAIFTGEISRDHKYRLKSMSGDAVMNICGTPSGFTATMASYSGDMETAFPLSVDGAAGPVSRRMVGRFGDGATQIQIEAFSGSARTEWKPACAESDETRRSTCVGA